MAVSARVAARAPMVAKPSDEKPRHGCWAALGDAVLTEMFPHCLKRRC